MTKPQAIPWRVFLLGNRPTCISPVSRLYLTVSLVSRVVSLSRIDSISIHFVFCSRSTVSRCIPLNGHCIQLKLITGFS